MHRDARRTLARWLMAAACGAIALSPNARADEAELAASMDCRSEPGSGRLLCTLTLVPGAGRSLGWSDALVVAAPPAVQPLRSRVASQSTEPGRIVVGFVLGSGAGGTIEVLARAVSCRATGRAGACRPSTRRVAFRWAKAG